MVRSMTKRGMPKPFAILIAALLAMYFVPFSAISPASATTPTFEIDGNQANNGAEDWADLTPGDMSDSGGKTNRHLVTFVDNASDTGADDTVFGSNNKEEGTGGLQWPNWSPTDNGNATGKSDYGRLAFYSYVENDHVFLVLGFDRGSNVGGTATDNYYFELNQNAQSDPDDPNPDRSAGDVRINLDDQGAGNITASLQTWDGDGWVDATGTGDYKTASNTGGAIGDLASWWDGLNVNDNGTIDEEGFIEASFDLTSFDVVLGCPSTGFSTVNGRSTTGNADKNLVDYFRATAINIPSNCANLVIHKKDQNGDALGGATFEITPNPLPDGTPGSDLSSLIIHDDSNSNTDVETGSNYDDPDATAGRITLAAVVPGVEYTITEVAAPAGYIGDPDAEHVTPVAFGGGSVTFTNVRETGSLRITKIADATGTFHFDVSCDDGTTANNIAITIDADHLNGSGVSAPLISGIPTGTVCTVTEDEDPLFTTVVSPGNGEVTIDTGTNTVTFTNTRKTGSLRITKIANATGTFHFDVSCDDGTTANNIAITIDADHLNGTGVSAPLIDNIPTGTVCTVTEDEDPLFTREVFPEDGVITIETGTNTVTFTNIRKFGTLKIKKVMEGDPIGTSTDFTVQVDCPGDTYDQVVALNEGNHWVNTTGLIPTGTVCTVIEVDVPTGWNPEEIITSDGTVWPEGTPAELTVGEGTPETASAVVKNERRTGRLEVTKVMQGEPAGASTEFTVQVDCTGDDYDRTVVLNEANDWTDNKGGIPSGLTCTVTEASVPAGWELVSIEPASVVIDSFDTVSVAVTNQRLVGSVEVKKVVVGDPAGASTDFTVLLDCDGTAYDQTLALNAGNGWTARVDGIPTLVQCQVTEPSVPAGWSLTSIEPSGKFTVMDTTIASVTVTNTRNTGRISVTKVLSGAPNGASTSFSFDVDCPGTAYDQQLTVAVTSGTSATATTGLIPTGLTCTVTEKGAPDWKLTSVVPAGGVVAVGSTVTFTNQRLQGTLNILKEVSPVAGNGVVVNFGDTLTYKLTVSATGEQRQPNVVVTDYLPGSDPARPKSGKSTYVPGSAACIGAGTCTVSGPDANGLITWSLGEMAAGTTRQVTFKVTIDDVAGNPGDTIAVDILNAGAVKSDRTPLTPSNEVVTPVTKVLPVKIAKPKELPKTGTTLPIGPAVGTGIVLLVLGLLLAGIGRQRTGIHRR